MVLSKLSTGKHVRVYAYNTGAGPGILKKKEGGGVRILEKIGP